MNWRALLHDKRVLWGGVAAAAAAGGYALWRRRGSAGGGSSATSTDASSIAPGGGYAGFPNTTGSDIATWAGNYSDALQRQLDSSLGAYVGQLQDSISALQTGQGSGSGNLPAPDLRNVIHLPDANVFQLPGKNGGTGKVVMVPRQT